MELINLYPEQWQLAKVEWNEMQSPDYVEPEYSEEEKETYADIFFDQVFSYCGASDVALGAIVEVFNEEASK